MAKKAKPNQLNPNPPSGNLTFIEPKGAASAVRQALGVRPPPAIPVMAHELGQVSTWENLKALAEAIAEEVMLVTRSLSESGAMVKQYGCVNVKEYTLAAAQANRDLEKFTDEFLIIKTELDPYRGVIATENETVMALAIYEKLIQFRTMFNGVMNHTQVTFTEFTLEAIERAKAMEAKKQAEDAANVSASATETQSSTQPAQETPNV